MTVVIEQGQFMPIRVTRGANLIYVEQGEHRMVVLEREFARQFASAIETGTAETVGLGPEDESAVPKGDAQ